MNWLDITLLCLAGIGFVKGLFDGIIKQVVSLIALVIAIFFCGKAAAWLKGYILALGWFPEEGVTILSYIAGFILIMGVFILAGELVTKVVGATPLSVINHLFGGFFGLLVVLVFTSLLGLTSPTNIAALSRTSAELNLCSASLRRFLILAWIALTRFLFLARWAMPSFCSYWR